MNKLGQEWLQDGRHTITFIYLHNMDKFHFTLVVSKLIICTLIKKWVGDDGVPAIL